MATKSEKRRPLAWLFSRVGKQDESPSFLRFMDNIQQRMKVFVDDEALTWPQIRVSRKGTYGVSVVRVDLAKPYQQYPSKKKLPVILLIHGFLGLNSYDGLLAMLPSHKYIAAAMHYGSVPNDLPPKLYSRHVVNNIDAVVEHFGSKGHPVYIFDHSMGNIYFLIIEREFKELPGIQKYLKGRIGSNPFFGEEAKHALLGFMDHVLIPSLSYRKDFTWRTMLSAARRIVPIDSKKGVRRRGIRLSNWLIRKDSNTRDRIWKSVKKRILYLMTNLGSLPELDRIPIESALNRLPAKIFAIQVHSALYESKTFDQQDSFPNMQKNDIPILNIVSERDIVAKFVPRIYQNFKSIDVTSEEETDMFREHLFHMIYPIRAVQIIEEFIDKAEAKRKAKTDA